MAELQRQEITGRIHEARKEAGLTQEEMAEALNVTKRAYWNYEDTRDDRGRVPWNLLGQISEITGKSKEWLLHGDPKPTPDLSAALSNGQPDDLTARLARIENNIADVVTQLDAISEAAGSTTELFETRFAELLRELGQLRRQAG